MTISSLTGNPFPTSNGNRRRGMSGNDRWIVIFAWCACSILALTSGATGAEGANSRQPFALHDTRHYRVTQELVLTPSNNNRFSRVRALLPIPVDLPHQSLKGTPQVEVRPFTEKSVPIDVSNSHFRVLTSEPFNMPMVTVDLRWPEPQPEWTVRLTSEVDVSNLVFDSERVRKVPYSELIALDLSSPYLRPETRVESEHPEIRDALGRIFPEGLRPVSSAYEMAHKIYDWILDRSQYERNSARGRASKLWGALDMLRTRRGECGDYSALFVALCRAAKIPARAQVGFWAVRERSLHVWAEFYLPDVGWLPVDPAVGSRSPRARTDAFGNLADLNERIAVTMGFDHNLPDQKVEMLQTYMYWFWYAGPTVNLRARFAFATE
jgi:hypothetical protein